MWLTICLVASARVSTIKGAQQGINYFGGNMSRLMVGAWFVHLIACSLRLFLLGGSLLNIELFGIQLFQAQRNKYT